MFENPRRSRQPRNFTTNVPKILDLKSSSEQIFCRKLSLGAPDASKSLLGFERLNSFGITSSWALSILKLSSWRGWKQPTSYGIVDNLKTWLTSVIPFLPFFLLYIKKVIKDPLTQRIPLKTTNSHNSRTIHRISQKVHKSLLPTVALVCSPFEL